jgi:transposase
MLIQAAWAAIRVRGRLQAQYNRLVRRFGGDKNPAAKKKAITAIAHTLLKIACQALSVGSRDDDHGKRRRSETVLNSQAVVVARRTA